ncbi:MAG: Efflux transporter permease subunit [Cyanobacteriota bacterium erpe_2018_sw_39hr_WHONDRS-SW48-000098_B_bin.30]|nr:Efflux transporter permease subunit [Cyanobacteriota bacterium erpe_2018_sw_39hr_WHONDRS-SW48-000098_B_bin.30]
MWIISLALRRPITVVAAVLSIISVAIMALSSMKQDIFPDLKIPAIYVIEGYGGMSPAQMEGYITSLYELYFLYVPGIEHIESKTIQNVTVIKVFFQPDTDMASAMAAIVAMANRATSLMPHGSYNPFVLRFDAGSLPVGQLVLASETKTVKDLEDLAYTRIRPLLATVPGAEAPPPFGGNIRSIVISVDADKLRRYNISGDEIIKVLMSGNKVLPAGNVRTGDYMRIAPVNSDLPDIHQLDYLPIRTGHGPQIFIKDIGQVQDSSDILAGYALYQGRRTVYIPAVKRADASTVSVVDALRLALPRMQQVLPKDVTISYQFDQSKYVREAINDVFHEGLLGTILPGLMILLFLRDLRSTAIVVTTIPLSLMSSIVGLWLCGQTINIQTLSGLALSIGILVDEATVCIENMHTHLANGVKKSRAVYQACVETMVPRLLAMLSVVAVFIPSFFMVGITRELFIPLSLAVGFAMVASTTLASTLVPIMAIWLLKDEPAEPSEKGDGAIAGAAEPIAHKKEHKPDFIDALKDRLNDLLLTIMPMRLVIIGVYLLVSISSVLLLYNSIGKELFPDSASSQFRVRITAPTGMRVEALERRVLGFLEQVKAEAGAGNVESSLGYAGQQPPMFPISSAFLWTSGPHQAVIDVQLKESANIDMPRFKDNLRTRLAKALPDTLFSFEPGDLVSQIMNLGSPTPLSVQITGHNLVTDKIFAGKVLKEMAKLSNLRDLQWGQPLDYPTVDIDIDRELAGQLGITAEDIGMSLQPAFFSSRFVNLSLWRDPDSGFSYQVQVQVPQDQIKSKDDIANFPTMNSSRKIQMPDDDDVGASDINKDYPEHSTRHKQRPLISDVAHVTYGVTTGEYDRYNMMRMVSLTANYADTDLGSIGEAVKKAVKAAGNPPAGVFVDVKGQVPLLQDTFFHLLSGLVLAVGVIALMLLAYFQQPRIVLVVMSTTPAILLGVLTMLTVTGTTLNVQSFMGAIMSTGVGIANAILLVVFAENMRQEGMSAEQSAIHAAQSRMRPILMTSIAMVAGMVPMALSHGQSAPLGRAVIGGLLMSTSSVLTLLPLVFTIIQNKGKLGSVSLHPEDHGE